MTGLTNSPADVGRLWARADLPADRAMLWADRYLDPETADEVLEAYEAERLRMALAD